MVRVERSIARIRRVGVAHPGAPGGGGSDEPAGLAFALDQRLVVTCAHVVNDALDRPLEDASPPGEGQLTLDFGLGGDGDHDDLPTRYAKVVGWMPCDGRRFECRDVAILELREVLPAAVVVPRLGPGRPGEIVCAFGPSPDGAHEIHIQGVLMGEVEHNRLQIAQGPAGSFDVVPGFSGGPVWLLDTGVVVGMLQARGAAGRTYAVAATGIDKALEAVPRRRPTPDRSEHLPPTPEVPERPAEQDDSSSPEPERTLRSWSIAMALVYGIAGFLLYQGAGFGVYHALPFLPRVDPVGTGSAAAIGVAVTGVVQLTGMLVELLFGRKGAAGAPPS
jgi:hypothetical protein